MMAYMFAGTGAGWIPGLIRAAAVNVAGLQHIDQASFRSLQQRDHEMQSSWR